MSFEEGVVVDVEQGFGRKSKPERPIKLDEIKGDTIQNLVLLHMSAKTAGNDLEAAIKAVAEKSGISAPVLRRYVNACAGDHYPDRKRDAEQLSLLFEEIKQ